MSEAEQKAERWAKRVVRKIEERFLLRFHMSLILLVMVGAGFGTTWLLHRVGLHDMMLRYPIAVLVSYFVFLGAVRCWLWYAFQELDPQLALPTDVRRARAQNVAAAREAAAEEEGDGFVGGFAGDVLIEVAHDPELAVDAGYLAVDAGEGIGEAIGDVDVDIDSSDGDGWLSSPFSWLGGDGDGGGGGGGSSDSGGAEIIVVILVVMLVAAIVMALVWVIVQAPIILTEAAGQMALAFALARPAKDVDRPSWMGSVFKRTWLPLLIVLILAAVLGGYLEANYPEATRLADVL